MSDIGKIVYAPDYKGGPHADPRFTAGYNAAGAEIAALKADRDRLARELEQERAARIAAEGAAMANDSPRQSALDEACDARDRLAAELAKLREEYNSDFFQRVTYKQQLREAEAELSAARADAERYRWLRLRNELTGEIDPRGPYVIEDDDGNTRWPTGNQIDAAIDAARAAPSAGGPQS